MQPFLLAKFDWPTFGTIIAALFAAFAAIITPMITALINNRHQSKMRKREILYSEKFNTYKELYATFGVLQSYAEAVDFQKSFRAACFKTLMICDKESAEKIKNIIVIKDFYNKFEPLNEMFLDCANSLQKDLDFYKQKVIKNDL